MIGFFFNYPNTASEWRETWVIQNMTWQSVGWTVSGFLDASSGLPNASSGLPDASCGQNGNSSSCMSSQLQAILGMSRALRNSETGKMWQLWQNRSISEYLYRTLRTQLLASLSSGRDAGAAAPKGSMHSHVENFLLCPSIQLDFSRFVKLHFMGWNMQIKLFEYVALSTLLIHHWFWCKVLFSMAWRCKGC